MQSREQIFLDIMLNLRNFEERLGQTFRKEEGNVRADSLEDSLEQHSVGRLLPYEELDEIYIQLEHINDSINCLVKENAVQVCEDILQYKKLL